jgi:hypothetical protein
LHQSKAEQKHISVLFEAEIFPNEWVHTDRTKVGRILSNLIDNAIKFTTKGYVSLHVKRIGDEVTFLVSDTGPGISYEEQRRLFKPFVHEQRRINWALKLVDALKYNHFEIFIQEIVPSTVVPSGTNKLRLEALVRLNDPQKEQILPPDLFIPAAERFNLLPNIDRWMIENVCAFFHEHKHLQANLDSIAINLSAMTITEPDLAIFVEQCFNRYAIAPSLLTFEITETERFVNLETAKQTLSALSELGCSLSIDDFGCAGGAQIHRDRPKQSRCIVRLQRLQTATSSDHR